MKLYALLIGIDDYKGSPLTQCVSDVGKMKSYLESLNENFEKVDVITLLDQQATRENIIQHLRDHIGSATDNDVALFYYSGHGAQEESGGFFPDEHDGLLECMVCYSADDLDTSQLLADKELRYLLSTLKHNPHLVTIFDACHSGDIVRAFHAEDESDGMIRRITNAFEAREYPDFLFAGDQNVEHQMADGTMQVFIPFKNHINISACLSSESSWEDSKGGVFTRYLLDLLKKTEGNLSYNDIARWSKISIKNVTRKKQTPIVTIQGEGVLNANQSWLNLHPDGVQFPAGFVTNNPKKGWIYSRGSLLGMMPGMDVTITLKDGAQKTLKVKDVDLEDSTLIMQDDLISVLDFNQASYPAFTTVNTYADLKLYINVIDYRPETENLLKGFLATYSNIQLVEADDADFYLTVFNQLVYYSLPEHDFQPLAEQISLIDNENLLADLKEQTDAFIKWQHFYSLENPSPNFDKCPIRVELKKTDGTVTDITNGEWRFEPLSERVNNMQYVETEIKITNVSREVLYVGVLALGSDLGITSNPFDNLVIELQPGETKYFYDNDEDQKTVSFSIDTYKEVYNWKEEWMYYKFIYNNYEDFSSSIQNGDFRQDALPHPIVYDPTRMMGMVGRGEGGRLQEVKKKWGTARTRIELVNDAYNIPSGDLLTYADEYASSPVLAPFIKELYFDQYNDGKDIALRLKQNKNQTSELANIAASRATDNLLVKLMNFVYKTSRRRKFLNQKHTTGPVVIAEGDSWFLFPKPGVRDTLDYIMEQHRLLSLAEAGDEIADYLKRPELINAVIEHKPKYVLLSGGGNDILGEEVQTILKNNVQNGELGNDYIDTTEFEKKLKSLENGYTYFIEEIKNIEPNVTVLIHGYDYILSNPAPKIIKNGWANRYMIAAKINDPEVRKKVIYYLVDSFNDMLKGLEKKYAHVKYIDNRNQVGQTEWMDEIHPNNDGFKRVAENFLTSMT